MVMNSTSQTSQITVMLVDDHAVVRQGTRDLLVAHPRIEVICEMDSGDHLTELIALKKPDVILLDINLPGQNGLALLALIRKEAPEQKVVFFTAHTDIQYIRKGLALRVDGYLSKTVSGQALQEAIFKTQEPNACPVYSADVQEKIDSTVLREETPKLTAREYEILLQVAQGMTNKEIANTLVLSVKTVDSHVAKLMKKLVLNNRAQLTAYAYQHGFL